METPILVIDTSYAIFFRFYAIKSYLKISKREDIELSVDNQEFREMFKRTFIETIHKLSKKFKPQKIIFALDCPRENIWRTEIMNDYKNRKNMTEFDGRVFPLTINEIIPDLSKSMKEFKIRRKLCPIDVSIIQYDNCEADDLVYIYCRRMYPEKNKIIITGDNDYLQLLDDKTEIYDLKMKSLKDKSLGSNEKDLLFKVLGGDPSDNIPSIMTKKKVKELLQTTQISEIMELYASNKKFINNMKMVDMNAIPERIIEDVMNSIHHNATTKA